jgi:membrane-associated phospholipid phosphatase
MLTLLNLLIFFFADFNRAGVIFWLNISLSLFIFLILIADNSLKPKQAWFLVLHDWYVLPLLIIIFFEHHWLIPLINPHDADNLLIAVDRFIFFGHHPTVLLEAITFPVLTQALQIIYATFYFLPLSLCFILYRNKLWTDFHIVTSLILIGFFTSYIGYFITPAIGPCHTLKHAQNIPLKGIFFFDAVRQALFFLEGITRDCCPRGHTLVSALTVLLARDYYRSFYPVTALWATGIIISTVYLRYHYVIDDIVGLAIAFLIYRYFAGPIMALIRKNSEFRIQNSE